MSATGAPGRGGGVATPPPRLSDLMTPALLEVCVTLDDTPPERWSLTQRMAHRLLCLWLRESLGAVAPTPGDVDTSGGSRGVRLTVAAEPGGSAPSLHPPTGPPR